MNANRTEHNGIEPNRAEPNRWAFMSTRCLINGKKEIDTEMRKPHTFPLPHGMPQIVHFQAFFFFFIPCKSIMDSRSFPFRIEFLVKLVFSWEFCHLLSVEFVKLIRYQMERKTFASIQSNHPTVRQITFTAQAHIWKCYSCKNRESVPAIRASRIN